MKNGMTGRGLKIMVFGGWKARLFAAALGLALICPPAAEAARGMTQLEYIQWLVQLSGDSDQFTETSSGADYLNWARNRGMSPRNGWTPQGKLTKEVLAETLVQFLRLNPYRQGDYLRTLALAGIQLPRAAEISRKDMAIFVDNALQPRHNLFRRPPSPHKPDRDRDRDDDRDRDRDRDRDDRPRPRDRDSDRDDDDDDRPGPRPPGPPKGGDDDD